MLCGSHWWSSDDEGVGTRLQGGDFLIMSLIDAYQKFPLAQFS